MKPASPETRTESTGERRLRLIAQIFLLWAIILTFRLGYLQIYRAEEYRKVSHAQSTDTIEIPAPRGRILDRFGQTLALSVPSDTIVVNPRIAPDLGVARDIFVPILALDRDRLQTRIDWAVENNRGYLPIKRKVSPAEATKIRSLNLDWVEFHRDSRRCYPKGELAAHILGDTDFRGQGNAGLELSFNEELMGRSGMARILRDARGRAVDTQSVLEPRAGADIGISIDERIQYVSDQALARAAEEWECDTGSIVVMDPKSGEILAMSSYPGFDPNARVQTAKELQARTNQAITVPYEPGSVFKIVTLSAALETTHLTPSSVIDCGPGVMRLFGRRIRDIRGYGKIPLEKVLWKSSNIGAIRAAVEVGQRNLLEYVKRFGFGQKTGIPLPAESAGVVRELDEWQRTSIGSVAMGHEISATTLQLALATSAIANNGLMPAPRLLLWKQQPGGRRVEAPFAPSRRVIRPETAITMRSMMEGVVLEGTGKASRLKGYSSGGKTGSAQIFDFEMRRYSHRYNSSFIGFAPVTDPAVVVVVVLNGAHRYGGIVAAPVFKQVAQAALRFQGTIPDVVVEEPQSEPQPEDFNDLAIADLGTPPDAGRAGQIAGDVDAEPLLLAERRNSPYISGPTVPDFYGKTLRAVVRETSRLGMPVEYVGAGVARAQYPPPGAILPVGDRVVVEFAR